MNIRQMEGSGGLSRDVAAAVIAAVEAFLSNEAAQTSMIPKSGISTWRMTARTPESVRGFGANVSWRGMD